MSGQFGWETKIFKKFNHRQILTQEIPNWFYFCFDVFFFFCENRQAKRPFWFLMRCFACVRPLIFFTLSLSLLRRSFLAYPQWYVFKMCFFFTIAARPGGIFEALNYFCTCFLQHFWRYFLQGTSYCKPWRALQIFVLLIYLYIYIVWTCKVFFL